MDSSILDAIDKFTAALTEATAAKGLVVDMRGYPGVDHYEVARRLATANFSSPIFRTPYRTGPDQEKIDETSYPLTPIDGPSFHGPIALIVGHRTVSAAENFSTMLVDAKRVHVVGRNSAGTNGNITGVQLPGHFAFTFTGMEVRHADAQKSVFHGVGIVPDKETALSAQDFAAGKDPELEEAISWLSMQ
jgi:C-terminal processing protease CtpA/Prc